MTILELHAVLQVILSPDVKEKVAVKALTAKCAADGATVTDVRMVIP